MLENVVHKLNVVLLAITILSGCLSCVRIDVPQFFLLGDKNTPPKNYVGFSIIEIKVNGGLREWIIKIDFILQKHCAQRMKNCSLSFCRLELC